MPIFSVNINRFDPYKNYRFLVYFGKSTAAAAAVSKVTGLKRSSEVIEYTEGGNAIILKGLGRMKYEPITLERGITFDTDFEDWADAAQKLDKGVADHVAGEPAQGDPDRPAERGRPARPPVHGASTAGCRNSRRCRISTRARTASRSSTSSCRTRDGSVIAR